MLLFSFGFNFNENPDRVCGPTGNQTGHNNLYMAHVQNTFPFPEILIAQVGQRTTNYTNF